jgi:hypothetical protein
MCPLTWAYSPGAHRSVDTHSVSSRKDSIFWFIWSAEP